MISGEILKFLKQLHLSTRLPDGVGVLNPYQDKISFGATTAFYRKFYNDNNQRYIILGINPGRFGGGITGIPFTDPVKLQAICGIENDFDKKAELSADFIYRMIEAFGGVTKFYAKYYVTALSPLGFVKDGKNLNYYDIRELQSAVEPFIVDCIQRQLKLNINRKVAYCLGEGANLKFLSRLNERYNFFDQIIGLPHPRFIMQYKRKDLSDYIERYLKTLNAN